MSSFSQVSAFVNNSISCLITDNNPNDNLILDFILQHPNSDYSSVSLVNLLTISVPKLSNMERRLLHMRYVILQAKPDLIPEIAQVIAEYAFCNIEIAYCAHPQSLAIDNISGKIEFNLDTETHISLNNPRLLGQENLPFIVSFQVHFPDIPQCVLEENKIDSLNGSLPSQSPVISRSESRNPKNCGVLLLSKSESMDDSTCVSNRWIPNSCTTVKWMDQPTMDHGYHIYHRIVHEEHTTNQNYHILDMEDVGCLWELHFMTDGLCQFYVDRISVGEPFTPVCLDGHLGFWVDCADAGTTISHLSIFKI